MVFKKEQKIIFLIFLSVIAFVVWFFVFTQENKGLLRLVFFEVGQGDAEFIETPLKQQVLIDGGPDMSILEKLGKAMPFYDRYIDLIILTHPEQDHLNGLVEVLKRYNVGAIITTGVVRETEQYKEWMNIIEKKKIPVYIAQSSGEIDFNPTAGGLKLDILYPLESLAGKQMSDSNNTSIVAKLVYGDFETLFTGDIEKSTEGKIISSGQNLQADILKIAHHGSKTSTGEEFLKAVDALLAVIEVGKDNKYGHPHQEVLDRLRNLNILDTKEGNIKIFSDGLGFEIN